MDIKEIVAWARPVYARPVNAPGPVDGWEAGEVVDIEFHNRAEKPEGEGWRPLVFANSDRECLQVAISALPTGKIKLEELL